MSRSLCFLVHRPYHFTCHSDHAGSFAAQLEDRSWSPNEGSGHVLCLGTVPGEGNEVHLAQLAQLAKSHFLSDGVRSSSSKKKSAPRNVQTPTSWNQTGGSRLRRVVTWQHLALAHLLISSTLPQPSPDTASLYPQQKLLQGKHSYTSTSTPAIWAPQPCLKGHLWVSD